MSRRVALRLSLRASPSWTAAFVAPIAFLATGCFREPWTPAVSVVYGSDVPPPQLTALPTYESAASQWELPPGNPWSPYQKMTLLSSLSNGYGATYGAGALPNVHELDVVKAATAAAQHVATAMPGRTAWVVDLRGAASVAFGAELRAMNPSVSCVLTFNNWPADEEMVPAEETLSALLAFSSQLPLQQPTTSADTPVFLLDAWRLAYRTDETPDDVMDNRYMLTAADLPDAATLRARGIDHVVYLVESLDDTEYEEDDLHETFLAYQAAGIHLSMVDLDGVQETELPSNGPIYVAGSYVVEPRATIVTDWRFYRRAHGGFGGIHGVPGGYGGYGLAVGGGFGYGGHGGFSFGHGGG